MELSMVTLGHVYADSLVCLGYLSKMDHEWSTKNYHEILPHQIRTTKVSSGDSRCTSFTIIAMGFAAHSILVASCGPESCTCIHTSESPTSKSTSTHEKTERDTHQPPSQLVRHHKIKTCRHDFWKFTFPKRHFKRKYYLICSNFVFTSYNK